MKYFPVVCFLPVFWFAGLVLAAQVEPTSYKNWKCLKMSNSTTEVYIAPEIGGRIIQYVYMGHPFLWVNRTLEGKVFPVSENNRLENWKNYGGDKGWPAPQGWEGPNQWPGPGDDIMDGPCQAELVQKSGDYAQVRLTSSGQGGYAGIQFITELTLFENSSRLYFRTTMKNVSRKETNWAVWRVTQMDFSGPKPLTWNDKACLVIPLNPKSVWPEKFKVMFGLAESKNWQPDYQNMKMIVRYMNIAGKIGLDTMNGWAAMVDENSGFSFVQRFETFPRASYSDSSSFYVWVAGRGEYIHKRKLFTEPDNPNGRFVEMEIVGPQIKLKPGEGYSLNTSWEAIKGKLTAVPKLEEGYLPPPRPIK